MKLTSENFRWFIRPGRLYLVTGPRGSGKTTIACQVAQRALDHGVIVLSNVILKKFTKDGWVEAYPPGYFRVSTMRDLMGYVPDILDSGKEILVLIDEAVLTTGFGAGVTVLSQDVRAILAWVTLLRKMKMTLVLIVLEEAAAMARYREIGAVVNGILRRGVRLGGYDDYELFELEGPKGRAVYQLDLDGFARPESLVEPGGYVFESTASASFGMGRLHDRPFDLMACLMAASDCIASEVPGRLRAFFGKPPDLPTPTSKALRGGGESTRKEVKDAVVIGLKAGERAIPLSKRLGCSKQYVYDVRNELRARGEL